MTQQQLAYLDEVLSHPRFREWALGNATDLDCYWEEWCNGDSDRRLVLERARELANYFSGDSPGNFTSDHIQGKIENALSASTSQVPEITRNSGIKLSYSWRQGLVKSAAAIVLASAIGYAAFLYSNKRTVAQQIALVSESSATSKNLHRIVNTGMAPRHLQLSDGSSVVLQPGSELEYPPQFLDDKREVRLSGEAFFEVVKNTEVPFYVIADQMVAKVVGTSFRIKAKPGKPFLELNVKSGTVAIFNNKVEAGENLNQYPASKITLVGKNEKALFKLSGNELLKQAQSIEIPVRLPIEKMSFQYENTSVKEVFSELESAYGVKISYNENDMSGCSLTAELGDEPLSKKIKWICSILEADYQVNDNQISITGKPCHSNTHMPMPIR